MRTQPRIVSLLPSATEIAVTLGAGESLFGRSHECDFPPFIRALPPCTSTKLEKGLTSREIDNRVQEIVRQGLSVYEVDAPLLKSLKPDVILTQSQCAVCAVTPADLEGALCSWVGVAPRMISLAPDTLDDVWQDLRQVGEAIGRSLQAERAIDELATRLAGIKEQSRRLPAFSVAAIEWIDPLMAAGNWVPELIEIAGGRPLFATPGQHSPFLRWEDLVNADPDVIVLMPCGFQIPQTLAHLGPLVSRPAWRDLRAVRNGRVFAADGHHYFNRPGPRLVESAEIVSNILRAAVGEPVQGQGRWVKVEQVVIESIGR